MRLKKTVARTMVFALALGLTSFSGSGVHKAQAAATVVTAAFDGVSGITTVKPDGSKNFVWGVAKKLKKAPKEGKAKFTQKQLDEGWYEVRDFEPVYGDKIDVFAASKGKETNILVVRAEEVGKTKLDKVNDYKLLKIEGPDKNFKVIYSADGKGLDPTGNAAKLAGSTKSGYLAFYKTDNKKATLFMPTGDDIQLKKGKNGAWKDLKYYFEGNVFTDDKGDKRLDTLVQNGAELTFRLKGNDKGWGSKEVKVKVTKTPNAPKVKVNVHKDTVSLKKGMMYKVMLADTALQDEKELTDPKKNTFAELKIKENIESDGDGQKKQTLEVYSKGAGKKLASKKAVITLQRQAAPFKGKGLEGAGTDEIQKEESGVVGNKSQNSDKNFVTLKLDTPYDATKGATLENVSTDTDYEFWVAWDSTQTAPKKWVSLKRTKDAEKPTKVKIKASVSKKEGTYKPGTDSESVLHIRVAGDDKSSDDVIKLGSAPLDVKLKMANRPQTLKTQLGSEAATEAVALEAPIQEETEYTFKVLVKGLVKTNAKPKLLNVKAKSGIAVKAEAFDETEGTDGSASAVTIKVDKKKIKEVKDESVVFDFTVEGVKKTLTVTLNKTT